MIPKLCAEGPPCAAAANADGNRGKLSNTLPPFVGCGAAWELEVVHSFNIKWKYITFCDIVSLWIWFFWVCCGKNQILCKNQCGTGNEGDGVQSYFKIVKLYAAQKAHMPQLVINCGYLRMQ